MAQEPTNSLVVVKAADSDSFVSLHPLVLLTASDLITRHQLRGLTDIPVGILLGQRKGNEITAEHAFTAKITQDGAFDQANDWTTDRIKQYKDVHSNPALEVVGWFSTCPDSGPLPFHASLHKHLITLSGENAIFLVIHTVALAQSNPAAGRLPISLYEGVSEADIEHDDTSMQIDGPGSKLKFRSIPYTVETDETELIAINHVAKGAGSAAAVASDGTPKAPAETKEPSEAAGKHKADSSASQSPLAEQDSSEKNQNLTPEEEDQIAGIATRLNSVKMLQSRLQLISNFVRTMPPSYVRDQSVPLTDSSPDPTYMPHLRNIQALLTRLSLLTPADAATLDQLQQAGRSQANDVFLASMLSSLEQDVQALTELGRKFTTVENGKSSKGKGKGGFSAGPFGSLEEYDGRPGGLSAGSAMML